MRTKATGVVRKVDDLGRFVIPKEIRKVFDIKADDPMEIFLGDNNEIILKQYKPGCQECGDVEVPLFGKNVKICRNCLEKEHLISNNFKSSAGY